MPAAPRQMWAITINTGYGVTQKDSDQLVKMFSKNRSFLVTEKTGDKSHYHGGIYFPKECIMGNVRNQILRLFPDFDEKQKKHAIIIKNWYNMDWYQNYCDKDEDVQVLHDTFKPEFGEVFPFPDPDDKQDVRPVSAWYHKLEKMILEDIRFEEPYNETTVLRALNTYQNLDRTIEVIADPKQLQQKCRALVAYIAKDTRGTYNNKRIRTEDQEEDQCNVCPMGRVKSLEFSNLLNYSYEQI